MPTIPRSSGIYKITCIPTKKIYIGSSQNLHKRVQAHIRLLRLNEHHNNHLQHAWNKYGEPAFSFEVLELVLQPCLLEREQYWLDKLKACDDRYGFNFSHNAGSPMRGMQHSEEAKAKMSQRQQGRTHSEETKRKMSAWHTGRSKSQSAIEKMRQVRLGRKASPETKAKLREIHKNPSAELRYKFGNAMRGKKRDAGSVEKGADKRRKEYVAISPDGERIPFRGLQRFCQEHGFDQPSVSKVIKGQREHVRGWRFESVDG